MKVMGGFQSEWFRQRNVTARQNGIMSGLPTLDTTTTKPSVGGSYNSWTTAGFFGRINYDFAGRYLFEANLRYDGSSRFRTQTTGSAPVSETSCAVPAGTQLQMQ